MIVYIVLNHIDYEGDQILGIYDSAEKANNAATREVEKRYNKEKWKKIEKSDKLLCYKLGYEAIYVEQDEVQ